MLEKEKVLLCGEGPTDYGVKEYGTRKWKEGPVQPIIRKTTGKPVLFENVEKTEVKKLRIQRGPKGGHAVKSYKLCVIARKRKINTIVCYVDADKRSGKGTKETVARKSFFKVYRDIRKGFDMFNERFNSHYKEGIVGIPMVPLRMIECWLLSDEKAFVKCFGKIPSEPPLPAKPELTWGDKDDPASDYPKHLMKRILNQYDIRESNREVFKVIAEAIDIETLRKKCPISYEIFHRDVREDFVKDK